MDAVTTLSQPPPPTLLDSKELARTFLHIVAFLFQELLVWSLDIDAYPRERKDDGYFYTQSNRF